MSSSYSDKYFEAVETCPLCGMESIYPMWDVTERGYVTKCNHCGYRVMLCDECMHADDNIERKCDWTEDGWPDGVCFRDNRAVTLYTHERSAADYNYKFDVPRNWLRNYLAPVPNDDINNVKYNRTLEEFMNNYTDFDAYLVYVFAMEDDVIIKDCYLNP